MPKDEPTPAPVVTDALLPCPFCGSDRVGVSTGQWGDEGTRDWLECRGCGTQQAPYDGDEPDGWSKMIARWNSRAMQAAQTVDSEVMEVLREMRRHHENDHDKLAYVALLALLAKLDRKGEGS